MSEYLNAGMRLYLDRLINWEEWLSLRDGHVDDLEAEVGSYRTILETTAALAQSFEAAGRQQWAVEATLTPDGGAEPPPHIREAYAKLAENGLVSLTVPTEYDGAAAPMLINAIYMEMISRADTSLMTVVGLQTGAAGDIERYGSEEIKRAYLPRFASGEVQGCMDLTEPQAGSDLGQIQTRATELPDGQLQVDGQKIFITNGGAEVHLVLARDAENFDESKGTTNGLSLILVPRHLPDGSANGVRVARLERKLGIHGSPTCEVVFEGAVGTRLGEKGQGFRAMLDLMNAARLGVAGQALGLSEAAFHDAYEYAQQREQFGKPIAQQPLVMSMLAKMGGNIEAVRALLYRTIELSDLNTARERALARSTHEAEREELQAAIERENTRIRLLTPLCKYFSTEVSNDLTRDAMQIFGGVGYTMDSDVAKLHADSLIMTVYEGTSEIQASFALREMGKGALGVVFGEARSELTSLAGDADRWPIAQLVLASIERVEKSVKILFEDIEYALLRSKFMAEMVIDILAGTELLRQAGVDPARLPIAESYIRRRMLVGESLARRIEENHEGRLERDARVIELANG